LSALLVGHSIYCIPESRLLQAVLDVGLRILQRLPSLLQKSNPTNKPMGSPRIDLQNSFPTSHKPLRSHRNRIIQQGVLCSASEQSTGKSASIFLEIFIVWRDRRVFLLLLCDIREEGADKMVNNILVENQGLRKVLERGESAKVIAAKVKEESGKFE
jgi:hypothetical protein